MARNPHQLEVLPMDEIDECINDVEANDDGNNENRDQEIDEQSDEDCCIMEYIEDNEQQVERDNNLHASNNNDEDADIDDDDDDFNDYYDADDDSISNKNPRDDCKLQQAIMEDEPFKTIKKLMKNRMEVMHINMDGNYPLHTASAEIEGMNDYIAITLMNIYPKKCRRILSATLSNYP